MSGRANNYNKLSTTQFFLKHLHSPDQEVEVSAVNTRS